MLSPELEPESEPTAAAVLQPQSGPPRPADDIAFWCLGSCKAATDLPWTCGDKKCTRHGSQLVATSVVYRCPLCKGAESRSPGMCATCDSDVRLDAWAVRCKNDEERTCEEDEWRPVIDTSQLPAKVTATCIPGGQAAPPVDGPVPRIPPRPSRCVWAGRKSVWEADLNKTGSNVLCVPPGARCTIDVKFSASWSHNSQDYCPGCVVQLYYGMTDVFRAGVVERGIHRHSGTHSTTFAAPTQLGTYYVTQAISLDYNYVAGTHANTFENSLAVVRVQTPVTVTTRRLAWAQVCSTRLSTNSCAAMLPVELVDSVGELLTWEFVSQLMNEEQKQEEIKRATAYYYGTAGGSKEGDGSEKHDGKCALM
eukprot:COSAG02_NODE_1125_length_14435_cov_97.039411_5_plen_366_part_00